MRTWTLAPLAVLLAGCGPKEPSVVHLELAPHCNGLLDAHCALPWPSNWHTRADSTSPTGLYIDYPKEMFPPSVKEAPFDVTDWNVLDGFSSSAPLLAAFDVAVDDTSFAFHTDIGASLETDSPTVLLDTETGARVPHFAELDARAVPGELVLLYLRPAARLAEGRRYIAALRLTDTSGAPVPASPAFAALRDGTITDHDGLEARRPAFDALFDTLATAGVERDGLTVAWDFTTASGPAMWGDLLHMRDDALERAGTAGPACTVDTIEDGWRGTFRRIQGTFTVPSYMNTNDPGQLPRLARGSDGKPKYVEDVEAEFVMVIPASVAAAPPGPVLQYGHGLLGSHLEAGSGAARTIAETLGVVVVATKWVGMSEDDLPMVAAALTDVSEFGSVADRLHQGMVNQWMLTRLVTGRCSASAPFLDGATPLMKHDERYWLGISQGGIFGGTFMALSPDIDRGVLNVGAAVYAFMVERSVDFDPMEAVYELWYDRRVDRQFLIAVMQQLWDKTDPSSYLSHLAGDPFPGTNEKRILYSIALNDAQVPNLASDWAARTAGFPLIDPPLFPVWGLETRAGPYDGSGYVYYDTGDPPVPAGNAPPERDYGGHGTVRDLPAHMAQMDALLQPGGVMTNPCGGPCVFK